MKITKDLLDTIRKRGEKALHDLGDDLGISFSFSHAKYDLNGQYATFKLELAVVGADGEATSREAELFKKQCHLYGLEPKHLGTDFTIGMNTYTITGLNPRAHKFPVNATHSVTGKRFKFPERDVQEALGLGEEADSKWALRKGV